MKQIWVMRFYLFFKRKIKNFSYQKALVFAVCLCLSSFLWLLSSLEKHYTSRISIPVKYIELPKDKQLSGTLPQKFDLIVDAYGYTLLSHKLRMAFSPVILNVNELVDNVIDSRNSYRYTISTALHKEEIEKQISSEIKILSIKPDTLVFNFSKIISKRIKIKPAVSLVFNSQYILQEEPFTIPDSLTVTGPKIILDTLKFVPTYFKGYERLDHSIRETIRLMPISGLKYQFQETKLSVNVEQNTEVSFDVPIQVVNCPADSVLKTFPGKIKVSCRIGLSKFKKLDINEFKAFIDYKKISKSEEKIVVSLVSPLKNLLSVNYSPKEVEYILEHEK